MYLTEMSPTLYASLSSEYDNELSYPEDVTDGWHLVTMTLRKHAQKLADILDRLDAAKVVQDMSFPGADLHPLKGSMKDLWAVRVSGNWRITFSFHEGNAYVIDYVDYY